MDISSNAPKVHGRALRANPVTISHFLGVPHYYWDVGRPRSVSDPGPDLSTKWISPQIYQKVHGRVLRANPVTISHFLCVPHYYWGVGRPGSVSDPGPDLSTKWISPQIHKKYTVVYSELIWSLLATSYTSLTIIGASDGRSGYRGQHPPPRLAHRPDGNAIFT